MSDWKDKVKTLFTGDNFNESSPSYLKLVENRQIAHRFLRKIVVTAFEQLKEEAEQYKSMTVRVVDRCDYSPPYVFTSISKWNVPDPKFIYSIEAVPSLDKVDVIYDVGSNISHESAGLFLNGEHSSLSDITTEDVIWHFLKEYERFLENT